jgi:ABC-2 type transport system ATP-binding protein
VIAIETDRLGKRYSQRWALRDCTVSVPEGCVVGLVGANGAGKTTLLHLTVGLLAPTTGTITALGARPAAGPEHLARVGFVAQEAPGYGSLTVAEHLRLGERLNLHWDRELTADRVGRLGLDLGQRAGRLSEGQRSQLALTLAMGKRPELLVLDEPVASLDPLARREFLQDLMELVAEISPTVVLSSHLLSDVERVCDYVIVLADGRVGMQGAVDDLLANHKILTGSRRDDRSLPGDQEIVRASHTDRQSTIVIRTANPVLDPHWVVSDIGLEDLVLAYMAAPAGNRAPRPIGPVSA